MESTRSEPMDSLPLTAIKKFIPLPSASAITPSGPLLVRDFKGDKLEGLLITLDPNNNTGCIICYPYADKPQSRLTLLFHTHFVSKALRERLHVNMCLQFVIGVCRVGFVPMEIVESKATTHHPSLPITTSEPGPKCKGRVIIAPSVDNPHGWIYNELDGTMIIFPDSDKYSDYSVGDYVRYNETNENPNKVENRHALTVTATDIVKVVKVDPNVMKSYCNHNGFVKYEAAHYTEDKKLKIDPQIILFHNVPCDDKEYADIAMIVELGVIYIAAWLNSSGGTIMMGVTEDGRITGQKCLIPPKMHYIKREIQQRLNCFRPPIPNEYYVIEFRAVVDKDGYVRANTYVIIIQVVKIHQDDEEPTEFANSAGIVYRRESSEITVSSKRTSKRDIETSEEQQMVADVPDVEDDTPVQFESGSDNGGSVYAKNTEAYKTPPNTELGRRRLGLMIRNKLNAMMSVEEYMLDERWKVILTMSSSELYNAQKTAWILMSRLERDVMSYTGEEKDEIHSECSSETSEKLADDCLPSLRDKSKYKSVATEYCQRMGWQRPQEYVETTADGYRATVSFGEGSAAGSGSRQKTAVYEAYTKLIPMVIPRHDAIELIIKNTSTHSISNTAEKHPKSKLMQWASKNKIPPPKKTIFTEFVILSRNMRIWTAKVEFCGKTVQAKGAKKKDAESKCFLELLTHFKVNTSD